MTTKAAAVSIALALLTGSWIGGHGYQSHNLSCVRSDTFNSEDFDGNPTTETVCRWFEIKRHPEWNPWRATISIATLGQR